MSLLHWSCGFNKVKMVTELVSAGTYIDAKDNEGWTPFQIKLVSAGADIRAVSNNGLLPMEDAPIAGAFITLINGKASDVIKYLMKEFYSSIFQHEGRLPLHALLEDESRGGTSRRKTLELNVLDTDDVLEIMAFLVSQDPKLLIARNQDDQLPLHVACATSKPVEIVWFLVDHAEESLLGPRTTDGALTLHIYITG
jgi:ankyrin repeat protein